MTRILGNTALALLIGFGALIHYRFFQADPKPYLLFIPAIIASGMAERAKSRIASLSLMKKFLFSAVGFLCFATYSAGVHLRLGEDRWLVEGAETAAYILALIALFIIMNHCFDRDSSA